jgi:hypothetical protein
MTVTNPSPTMSATLTITMRVPVEGLVRVTIAENGMVIIADQPLDSAATQFEHYLQSEAEDLCATIEEA